LGRKIHQATVNLGQILFWPKLLQLASKAVAGVGGRIRIFKRIDFPQTSDSRSLVPCNLVIVKTWREKNKNGKDYGDKTNWNPECPSESTD
jgi:hypothetical protein